MNDALRVRERWYSDRLQADITVVRWGVLGVPVLVFPTAGGDAEEIERHGLVNACGPLLAEGRIKLYSVDSVAGQAMVAREGSAEHRMWLLNQFQEAVRWEVVPAIHADLGGQRPRRHHGRRLDRRVQLGGDAVPVPGRVRRGHRDERQLPDRAVLRRGLEPGPVLLRAAAVPARPGRRAPGTAAQRRVILASGEGDWEDISSSWQMAGVLGDKGIPNRVDNWGPQWPHEWHTWREMLPQYLRELT